MPTRARSTAGTPSVPPVPAVEPTEDQMMRAILEAAGHTGWICAHFRPARTINGRWVTPVQGQAKGFPDIVAVHPTARHIWFVELKTRSGKLSADQILWRDAIEAAGGRWAEVRGRAGLRSFLADLVAAARRYPDDYVGRVNRDAPGYAAVQAVLDLEAERRTS